jgi:hypothetical protein
MKKQGIETVVWSFMYIIKQTYLLTNLLTTLPNYDS